MTKELIIALEISRSVLAEALLGLAKGIPGVKTLQWAGPLGEKGALAVKTIPDVIIIDDSPEVGQLLNRVRVIKDNFPQTALFVISANHDAQHIINVMKAGAAEYLVEPVSKNTFINAIEEVRAKLANAGRLAQGNIYSFISAKGGVGATVLAVNTAVALAVSKKHTVALLDLSLQSGDTSVLLDIVPQTTILDICQNIHRLDIAFLRGAMIPHNSGIGFLAAPRELEDCDEIRSEHIAAILDLIRKLHDNIVIDCSSMLVNDCTIEALRRSDKVFVVTDMSVPSIRNTTRLFKLIRKFGIPNEQIEIVINRFIKDSVLSIGEIEKNFEKPVYWLVPNDFTDIVSSINRGVPLVKLSPGAPFSRNILELVYKFKEQQTDPSYRGIRNLFGKSL
jgi:pilus assembly protein CpaE